MLHRVSCCGEWGWGVSPKNEGCIWTRAGCWMCDKRLRGLLEQRPLVLFLRHSNNYISLNELGMLRCVILTLDHEIFFISKIFSFCLSLINHRPFLFWKCDAVATAKCSIDSTLASHPFFFFASWKAAVSIRLKTEAAAAVSWDVRKARVLSSRTLQERSL